MNKKRESKYELLRIISMLLIIAHHFSVHGGFKYPNNTLAVNSVFTQILLSGGKLGVNIFVLISGYFLSKSKIKVKRIICLCLQILFYSLVIFGVFTIAGLQPFSIKELIKNIFPISYNLWWFASTYIALYLLSPFINKVISVLSKKQYRLLLIIMFVMWSFIPTLLFTFSQANDLLWFVFLYLLAGYIRIHLDEKTNSVKRYCIITIALIFLIFLLNILFDVLGMKIAFFAKHATTFYSQDRVTTLLIAVFMFLMFKNLKIKPSVIINSIASTVFGVYLIHDHPWVRKWLWTNVLANNTYAHSKWLVAYAFGAVCVVFVVCSLIEFTRLQLLEKHYMNKVEKISNVIIGYYNEKFR